MFDPDYYDFFGLNFIKNSGQTNILTLGEIMSKDEILNEIAGWLTYTTGEHNDDEREMKANLFWLDKRIDELLEKTNFYKKHMESK